MSVGRVVLGAGLFLDVVGTLFISWDVRKGQDATKKSVSVLQYLIQLGNSDAANDLQILNTEAIITWCRILEASGNQQLAPMRTNMEEWVERWKILAESEPTARKRTDALVDNISNELVVRRQLILAAILLVFIGGVLEFIAGVWLGV